jgi:hypothetical protein
VAAQTLGYREVICVAASTGKAIAELDDAGLAAARVEARGHIWSTRDGSGVVTQTWRVADRPSISDESHSVASAVTTPELEISLAQQQTTTCYAGGKLSAI